jgi:hypothetical protein
VHAPCHPRVSAPPDVKPLAAKKHSQEPIEPIECLCFSPVHGNSAHARSKFRLRLGALHPRAEPHHSAWAQGRSSPEQSAFRSSWSVGPTQKWKVQESEPRRGASSGVRLTLYRTGRTLTLESVPQSVCLPHNGERRRLAHRFAMLVDE